MVVYSAANAEELNYLGQRKSVAMESRHLTCNDEQSGHTRPATNNQPQVWK